MKNKLTVFALLMFLFTSMSFAQYYVDGVGGNDGGGHTGLVGDPWQTIQYAVDNVPSGLTIYVVAGSYNLTGSVTLGVGISIGQPLTLIANDYFLTSNNTSTVLSGLGTNAIDIRINASDVTIQGFTIDFSASGANKGGIEVNGGNQQNFHLLNNIIYLPSDIAGSGNYAFRTGGSNNYSGLHINNNTFIGDEPIHNPVYTDGLGIYLNPTNTFGDVTDIQVNGNTFSGKVLQGINNAGMSNCTIDGNTLSTEISTVTVDQPYLIRVTNDNAAAIHNIVISNNVLGAAGPDKGGKNGIILRNPTGNVNAVTISDNVIQNGIVTGIHQEGNFTNVTYSNNTISNNPIGIEIVAGSVTSISNNEITNNTGDGIKISGVPTIGSINSNSLVGNGGFGINNLTGTIIDGTDNWWGNASGPSHSTNTYTAVDLVGQVPVSDNVTFVPWWRDVSGSAAAHTLAGTSFAPVENPGDGTMFSSIQGAIDAATTADGETLTVTAGTYTETVTVDKELNLVGTGTPTVTGGFILAATPVTITGFNLATTDEIDVHPGGSIQDALTIVNDDGIINVAAGTYSHVTITKGVQLLCDPNVIITTASPAITVSATGVTINGATFNFVTDEYAIDVTAGAYDVTIVNCDFLNTTFGKGVRNQGTGTVTATHNYWGDPGGPTISSSSCGIGCSADNVSTGSLIYSPWYIDFNPHNTLMAAPVLVAPLNSAVGVTVVPYFDWTFSLGGGTTYTIEIATDAGFTNIVYGPVATLNGGTDTDFQLPDANALSNSILYHWRIKATLNGVTACATRTFTTISAAMPYLTNPSNGADLLGTTTTFSWYTGVAGIKYTLEINTQSNFGGTVKLNTTTSNTYLTVNNSLFDQSTTYYWRVIAQTIPLSGNPVIINFSNTWQFNMPGLPQPTAAYPVGNVSVYINPPILYWYMTTYNSKVTEYHVRYRISTESYHTAVDGVPGAGEIRFGTAYLTANEGIFTTSSLNTYITIPFALTPGARYYYQVCSADGSTVTGTNKSDWSDEASFTIYGNQTFVVCYPSFPVGGGSIYANPPTLYWYTNMYAPGLTYKVEWSQTSDYSGTVYSNTTLASPVTVYTSSYTLPSSLSTGHWYWRVSASFDGGSTYGPASTNGDFDVPSSSTAASVTTPSPAAPTSGLVVNVTNPTLSWYAYTTVPIQFQVIYSTDPTFGSGSFADVLANIMIGGVLTPTTTPLLNSRPLISSNSYILTGLTPGATYYWQVRAKLATSATYGSWSAVAWFTTAAGSASVVPLAGSPLNGFQINSTSADLSWILPTTSTSPMTYTVQYGKQIDFSDATTIPNVTSTKISVNNLEKGTTYYWRASSKNSTGSSAYSSYGSFKTDGTTAVEQETIPTQFELSQNYPNPFNPTTKISYALPQNSYVSIKVYDMLGREVRSLVNSEMLAGNHSIEWSGENNFGSKVASGTYIYRITAGNYISTKKMVLIK